ncbi:GNAT family N-acetyltransferase [Roseibium alexandrii]|uniref:GNAT family N-acetyltransferase n=1 Tax=Roseibium alexandrii TaxID=388408 RepID=UPI0039EE0CA1
MNDNLAVSHPGIRRLWQSDLDRLTQHFQRLDSDTRRLRFAGKVSDGFVDRYAESILSVGAIGYGAFPDHELRGIAELRELHNSWPRAAELALVVERDWQEKGIGKALFNRVIAAAQTRQIKTIHMLCLIENTRMRNLAKRHDANLAIDSGIMEATLSVARPSPITFLEKLYGDPCNILRANIRLGD